jgi:hypothetical protein
VKLAIGLLLSHGFPAPTEFWSSFHRMQENLRGGAANSRLPKHLQVDSLAVLTSTSFPVDYSRNQIVRDVLKGGYDYLFFADCDEVFPEDCVERLLQHDVDVVTARYHMRKEPYHCVGYVKHRVLDGPHCYAPVHYGTGLIEIERGGAGALLIKRDVLVKIQDRIGENWFRYQRSPDPPYDMSVSEDFWFYQQAREAGFKTLMDWDVEVGHLQTFAINRSWNQSYLDANERELPRMAPEARRAALDSLVVCGYPDGYTLASGDVVPAYEYQPGER